MPGCRDPHCLHSHQLALFSDRVKALPFTEQMDHWAEQLPELESASPEASPSQAGQETGVLRGMGKTPGGYGRT